MNFGRRHTALIFAVALIFAPHCFKRIAGEHFLCCINFDVERDAK